MDKSDFSGYILYFYIDEGERVKINDINFNYLSDLKELKKIEKNIEKLFDKNNRFYNLDIIEDQIFKLEELVNKSGSPDSTLIMNCLKMNNSMTYLFLK